MSPTTILVWCFAAVLLAIIVPIIFARRPKFKSRPSQYDGFIDFGGTPTRRNVDPPQGYRDGGTVAYNPKPGAQTEFFRAKPRPFGGRKDAPPVFLSPRMLERMNAERRRRGVPLINRTGVQAAVATAAVEERTRGTRQPDTINDWLTYLIVYECLIADHQTRSSSSIGGVTIDPSAPFNGQGGEFGGAGASGDWAAPAAVATTGLLAADIGDE